MSESRNALAQNILRVASPLGASLLEVFASSNSKMKSAAAGDLQNLEVEAAKQKLVLEAAKVQAQVAQEMAIAERIQTATEVQIEEFYDTDHSGRFGVNADEKNGIAVGVSGDRRVVTKRIYILKGWKDTSLTSEV